MSSVDDQRCYSSRRLRFCGFLPRYWLTVLPRTANPSHVPDMFAHAIHRRAPPLCLFPRMSRTCCSVKSQESSLSEPIGRRRVLAGLAAITVPPSRCPSSRCGSPSRSRASSSSPTRRSTGSGPAKGEWDMEDAAVANRPTGPSWPRVLVGEYVTPYATPVLHRGRCFDHPVARFRRLRPGLAARRRRPVARHRRDPASGRRDDVRGCSAGRCSALDGPRPGTYPNRRRWISRR